MTELRAHAAVVSQWLDRNVAGRSTREVMPAFGRALLAIWDRAHLTLGEVTLRAVFDRVMLNGRKRFPSMIALALAGDPATFRALDAVASEARSSPADPEELAAIRFVLTEVLVILGSITGEVLSPPLHAALDAVHSTQPSPPANRLSKGEEPS